MSDEEPSEYQCVPNAEFVTRRLLAYIRNHQAHCTDEGCFEDSQTPSNTDGDSNTTMLMLLLIFATVLCFWRASTYYRSNQSLAKKEDHHDQSPPPPAPPAMH